MTAAFTIPAYAFSPQVCRQSVAGYETFTDCYGMEITGVALRDAQVREMVSMKRPAREIASELGVSS